MSIGDGLSGVLRVGSDVFLPVRRLAGPLHRRRRAFTEDPNDQLPPLPAPWEDERWFRGSFPPRRHNVLEPLVDGEAYLSDLLTALRAAEKRVTIVGWALTAMMALERKERQGEAILAEVLRDVSARAEVYVLLWSGAPALFKPTSHMEEGVQEILRRAAPRVRCALDHQASFSHDHHQKAVTIDGHLAYVGGMDLTTFEGDRWDTPEHALRLGPNWHDVQVRMRGEVVRDVEDNFCQRWNVVTGEEVKPLPAQPEGNTPAQIVRTVPAGFYPFAEQGDFGIFPALTTAIRRAERFVYLENQYIWSPEIVDALVAAMNRPRSTPFRVILILPAKAMMGRYDNDQHVRLLTKVDGSRGMFQAYTPYASGPAVGPTGYRYLPIYVHAKVSIVDDEWFSCGSANLNRRGLAGDTEMNVQSIAPAVARALRVELWAEHLGIPEEQVAATDPIELADTVWPQAADTVERCERAKSVAPAAQIRRYVPGRSPESRALDVLEGLTLEH